MIIRWESSPVTHNLGYIIQVCKTAINELYLVQISGLWVHMGTIKHTSLLATSALIALVTLLLN